MPWLIRNNISSNKMATRTRAGLAEYRNGGLLVDMGVLVPRDPAAALGAPHAPESGLVVEWRALTVALLDVVRCAVRYLLCGHACARVRLCVCACVCVCLRARHCVVPCLRCVPARR